VAFAERPVRLANLAAESRSDARRALIEQAEGRAGS
jgi:hypothetical protein